MSAAAAVISALGALLGTGLAAGVAMLSAHEFTLVLVVGAAALAFWLALRFPERAPKSLRATLFAFGLALALPMLTLPLLVPIGSLTAPLVAILLVALPTLVYLFLAAAWFVTTMARMLNGFR